MTIGQRIAECRKNLGLSQEALGGKMGVSRQAICKWEADGALPEIDKLISLSKLFGVSVGWLLGVEEQPTKADVLTEEQLSAMELLIKTYVPPTQPEKKESRKPLILSAAAMALSAVTLLTCLTHHKNLSNSLSNMSYQMVNLLSGYDTVQAKINDLESGEAENAVPSELHGFTIHLTPDTTEPKVTVQLSAVPKQHKVGWEAVFSARKDGKEVSSADCSFDNTAYTAELELPMADGYEYWLVLRSRTEGIQEQIPLSDSQAENLDFISPESSLELRQRVSYDYSGAFSIHDPPIRLAEGDSVEVWLVAYLSNGMECREMVGSWRYEGGEFLGGESANQD